MTDFRIKKKEAGDPFESEEERDHDQPMYDRTGLTGGLSVGATRERGWERQERTCTRETQRYVSILRGKHPCATVSWVVALVDALGGWFPCVWGFLFSLLIKQRHRWIRSNEKISQHYFFVFVPFVSSSSCGHPRSLFVVVVKLLLLLLLLLFLHCSNQEKQPQLGSL